MNKINEKALFKGKRTSDFKWIEGCLADLFGKEAKCIMPVSYYATRDLGEEDDKGEMILGKGFAIGEFFPVVQKSIGQYIGMVDSKGIKIYEGDIFDVGQTINGQSRFVVVDCIGKFDVRYEHNIHRAYEYDVNDLLSIEEITVVGNIHD